MSFDRCSPSGNRPCAVLYFWPRTRCGFPHHLVSKPRVPPSEKRPHLSSLTEALNDVVQIGLDVEPCKQNNDGAVAEPRVFPARDCAIQGLETRGYRELADNVRSSSPQVLERGIGSPPNGMALTRAGCGRAERRGRRRVQRLLARSSNQRWFEKSN